MIKLFLWAMPPSLYSRLVYLDLDVLVQHNIDALLAQPFVEWIGAVQAMSYRCARWETFNGGVLVIKPSSVTLRELLLRTCWAAATARITVPRRDKRGAPSAEMRSQPPASFWGHTASPFTCARAFLPADKRANRNLHENFNVPGNNVSVNKVCERSLLDQSLLNFHYRGIYHRLPFGYNAPAHWKRPPPVRFDEMAVLHYLSEPKPWSAKARSEWAAYAARESEAGSRADPADAPRPWSAQTVEDVQAALWGRWLGACGRHLPP